ncbi:uncharacterized protein PFL1_05950 [Pseudozyma flocculosa PF-1]|uniref:Uncharacterized protein n=1 Tax=Pseudozyma flocculosa PF-1 TaxID=1277687 RepID=A0A061H2Y1_9BASI|nr:uncharacterized protein PFL1_05950 [Pseudozyma flocculosa PF-1]EPQ26629.1 hypothetical protein PFL1_05950 [Pseudozyma flocculosa PF-1]
MQPIQPYAIWALTALIGLLPSTKALATPPELSALEELDRLSPTREPVPSAIHDDGVVGSSTAYFDASDPYRLVPAQHAYATPIQQDSEAYRHERSLASGPSFDRGPVDGLDLAPFQHRAPLQSHAGTGSSTGIEQATLRTPTLAADILPRSPARMNELLKRGIDLLRRGEYEARYLGPDLVGIGGDELRSWLTTIYRIRLAYSRITEYDFPDGWRRFGRVEIDVVRDYNALANVMQVVRRYTGGPDASMSPGAFHGLTWPMQDFPVGDYRIHVHTGRGGEKAFRSRPWANPEHPVVAYYRGPPDQGKPKWIVIGRMVVKVENPFFEWP